MEAVVKCGQQEEQIPQSPPSKKLKPDLRDEAEGYIGDRKHAFLGSGVEEPWDGVDFSDEEDRAFDREFSAYVQKIIDANGYEFEFERRFDTAGGFIPIDINGKDKAGFLRKSYELLKFAIDQHNSKPEIMGLVAKDRLAFDKLLIANVGASGNDYRLTFTAIKESSGDRVTCQAAICPSYIKGIDHELWQLRLKPGSNKSDGATTNLPA